MKKIILLTFCIVGALVFTSGAVTGLAYNAVESDFEKSSKVTVDQARKTALAKVPGKVENEYAEEDDDGEVTEYVFEIRKADKKLFEVKVDAEDGKVTSVEEVEEDEEEEEDPPANSL